MDVKKIFIIVTLVLVMAIALVSMGIAYVGGVMGIGLLGILFFLTFGIVVVLAQLIPAAILFSSLIGAVVSPSRRAEIPIRVA